MSKAASLFDAESCHDLLAGLIEAAREAGRAVLDVYGGEDYEVEYKSDSSPVTEADRRSHQIITALIGQLSPGRSMQIKGLADTG